MLQCYYYTIAMQVYSTYAPIYKLLSAIREKKQKTTVQLHTIATTAIVLYYYYYYY